MSASAAWTLPGKIKCAPTIDVAVRARALDLLVSMLAGASDQSAWMYARNAEQAVYRQARQRSCVYRDRVKRLAHAVREDPELMELHRADVLAELGERNLDGEDMRRWRAQYEESKAAQKLEEQQYEEEEEEEAPGGAFIKCKQCGSLKVTWTQAQTRSADESMTVFYQCSKCQKRWKG